MLRFLSLVGDMGIGMTIDLLCRVRVLQGLRRPQRVKTITDLGGYPDENESASAMAMEQSQGCGVRLDYGLNGHDRGI